MQVQGYYKYSNNNNSQNSEGVLSYDGKKLKIIKKVNGKTVIDELLSKSDIKKMIKLFILNSLQKKNKKNNKKYYSDIANRYGKKDRLSLHDLLSNLDSQSQQDDLSHYLTNNVQVDDGLISIDQDDISTEDDSDEDEDILSELSNMEKSYANDLEDMESLEYDEDIDQIHENDSQSDDYSLNRRYSSDNTNPIKIFYLPKDVLSNQQTPEMNLNNTDNLDTNKFPINYSKLIRNYHKNTDTPREITNTPVETADIESVTNDNLVEDNENLEETTDTESEINDTSPKKDTTSPENVDEIDNTIDELFQ